MGDAYYFSHAMNSVIAATQCYMQIIRFSTLWTQWYWPLTPAVLKKCVLKLLQNAHIQQGKRKTLFIGIFIKLAYVIVG